MEPIREEQVFPSNDAPRQNPLMIPGAIIVAGVLIAGAVIYSNSSGTGARANKEMAQIGNAAPVIEGDLADNGPVLGNPAAPVTLVEFADFQCPFCGRFFKTTEKDIIEKYVKTGKVKFVYRDFAFLGQESEWAAEAAKCARDQNKFWEYHDYLYTHQNGENVGAFAKANLKKFAREIGLNGSQFDSCLDSGKHTEEVRSDTEAGRTAGVGGTPTSFVNGRVITGAVPFAQFDAVIQDALKKAK